jgi:polynucleotide 5'-kinase involved in rRNA processing
LGKLVSNQEIVVNAGKTLPFEPGKQCRLLKKDDNGSVWLAPNFKAGTSMWQNKVNKIFKKGYKKIILIGESDSGKSTLATFIINLAINNGIRPAIIDCDMGQGDIAPPTSIGAAFPNETVTDLRDIKKNSNIFEFVGNTSPVGFEEVTINAILRISKKIAPSDYDICIFNTDGYVYENVIDFKTRIIDKLNPDAILCIGDMQIYHTLKGRYHNVLYYPSSNLTIKSRAERIERRISQFMRFLQNDWSERNNYKNQNHNSDAQQQSTNIINRTNQQHNVPGKPPVISKHLGDLTFVYKENPLRISRMLVSDTIHLNKSQQIRPIDMIGMFVGLALQDDIVGFGIIFDISPYCIFIKTVKTNFDRIYLSNCILSKDMEEFRIFKQINEQ